MRQRDGRAPSADLPPPERLVIVRPRRRSRRGPRDRQGELSVRIVFETDERYELRVGDDGIGAETGRRLVVPAGTRLVGTSTHIQPLFYAYHIFSGVTDWRVPIWEVTFTYISDEITEEGVQEAFAQECITLAEDHAHPGGHQIGLFGPYTKNTTLRSRPPGLKRLGANWAMLVKELEWAWDRP